MMCYKLLNNNILQLTMCCPILFTFQYSKFSESDQLLVPVQILDLYKRFRRYLLVQVQSVDLYEHLDKGRVGAGDVQDDKNFKY